MRKFHLFWHEKTNQFIEVEIENYRYAGFTIEGPDDSLTCGMHVKYCKTTRDLINDSILIDEESSGLVCGG